MVYHVAMRRVKYSAEVLVQNGRIRRSRVLGVENARDDQRVAIERIKPLLNAWIRDRISLLDNSTILVKCKYAETSNGLNIEFKMQAVQPNG